MHAIGHTQTTTANKPTKIELAAVYQQRGEPMPDDVERAEASVPSFYEAGHKLLGEMKTSHVPTLIIDLRGNGGGVTPTIVPFMAELFGDDYFAHKFKGQFVQRKSALLLQKYHQTLDDLRKAEHDPTLELGDYVPEEEAVGSGPEQRNQLVAEYVRKGYSFAKPLQALDGQPYYRPRRILVLSNPGTFSAAFHFLAFLKEMGAEIVGVPPGQSPNAFMEVTPFRLSRSMLEGSISNSAQVFSPEAPTASVYPVDHPLTWQTAARFDFDEDAAVWFAMSLAQAGTKHVERRP